MSSTPETGDGSVPDIALGDAMPSGERVELYTVGPVASRALSDHPGVRAVGPEDLSRLDEEVPVLADGTPSARWVTCLPAERYDVVERGPRVQFDPTAELWAPRGESVASVRLGTTGGDSPLPLPPGFTVQDVRAAVRSRVPPDVLPVLVVDRSDLLSDLEVAIGVAAAASMHVPAVVAGAAPTLYLGHRTASAVASRAIDDPRSWSVAAGRLRAAAVAELVGPGVGRPPGRSEGRPDHAVVIVDGAAVRGPRLAALAEAMRGQTHVTVGIVAVGRPRPPERDDHPVPVHDIDTLAELPAVLGELPASLVTRWVEGVRFDDLHLAASARALSWAAGAPVRCGLSSVRVTGVDIEVGGPIDLRGAAPVAASPTSVNAALEGTGGRSLDVAFSWLAHRSTYLHTATASRSLTAAEAARWLGSVLDDHPQWTIRSPEVSA